MACEKVSKWTLQALFSSIKHVGYDHVFVFPEFCNQHFACVYCLTHTHTYTEQALSMLQVTHKDLQFR